MGEDQIKPIRYCDCGLDRHETLTPLDVADRLNDIRRSVECALMACSYDAIDRE